jgi:hypothetical protein
MSVEPAWIREQPNDGVPDPLGLRTHDGVGSLEGVPVRRGSKNGQRRRPVSPDLPDQSSGSRQQLLHGELVRPRRRPRHEVRDAETGLEQGRPLVRFQQPRGEAGVVKCGPEPVSRAREVVSDGAGVEAGVDAGEEDAEAGRDQIGNQFRSSGFEFLSRGPGEGTLGALLRREGNRPAQSSVELARRR